MDIWGTHIETVTVIQLLAAAVVIATYSFIHSLHEGHADHVSDSQMLLLSQFILEHHPDIRTLEVIGEGTDKTLADNKTHIYWLNKHLDEFQLTGKLPARAMAGKTTLFENVMLLVIAPLYAFASLGMELTEAREYRVQRILHTEMRKNYVSKNVIAIFSCCMFIVVATSLIVPRWPRQGWVIVAACSIATLCAVIEMIFYVWHQTEWKDYWQEKLSDVMASAAKEKNHDLFNRALALRNYIELQPDVPVPATVAFYGGVLGATQAVILWLSKML